MHSGKFGEGTTRGQSLKGAPEPETEIKTDLLDISIHKSHSQTYESVKDIPGYLYMYSLELLDQAYLSSDNNALFIQN